VHQDHGEVRKLSDEVPVAAIPELCDTIDGAVVVKAFLLQGEINPIFFFENVHVSQLNWSRSFVGIHLGSDLDSSPPRPQYGNLLNL